MMRGFGFTRCHQCGRAIPADERYQLADPVQVTYQTATALCCSRRCAAQWLFVHKRNSSPVEPKEAL